MPPYEKIFAVAHGKIASDPEVWGRVEEFILREIRGLPAPRPSSADAQSPFH